jgi:catechol-2,3-dioxygenase
MARGNPFGHVDLRVTSMEEALPFYEALMPELGFSERHLDQAEFVADPCGNRFEVYFRQAG